MAVRIVSNPLGLPAEIPWQSTNGPRDFRLVPLCSVESCNHSSGICFHVLDGESKLTLAFCTCHNINLNDEVNVNYTDYYSGHYMCPVGTVSNAWQCVNVA